MIRPAGIAAGALATFLAAAVWTLHDYRLPQAAHARALDGARTWERKNRIDSKGIAQVWVPPGCFEMGSSLLNDLSARANETPRHTV